MATLTLYNGDCLEVMKEIPDKSISLIICDLPYGCLSGRAIGKAAEIKKCWSGAADGCAWDTPIDLAAFWEQVRRIRKDDHTPTIHFCTTKFGFELHASNPKEFRYDLVWDKQRGVSFLTANKMPMRSHEMIYVFSKVGANYYRKDIVGDFKGWKATDISGAKVIPVYSSGMPNGRKNNGNDGTKRCVLSVIKQSGGMKKDNHPTEKPMELYKWLIERYSKPGDTILDPTFGSGNSVFTAFDMDRSAIGIEKDEGFYKKAADKLDAS